MPLLASVIGIVLYFLTTVNSILLAALHTAHPRISLRASTVDATEWMRTKNFGLLKERGVYLVGYLMQCGRDTAFRLEAILAPQPFRERPGADSYLRTSEHRTEVPDLGRKVPLPMPTRLALHGHLAFGGPERSPVLGEVPHLDQVGRHR